MLFYIWFLLIFINLKEYKGILLKGKRAQDGQFPWLIQFQTVAPCGGVLLSPDWVLTAAQCVHDKRNSITLFATGLNGTNSKQTLSVKATYIYPTYKAYSVLPDRDHNIALLKLTKPFDMCHNKIILPNIMSVKYDNDYKLCLIFGWQSYVSLSSKVLAKPIQYYEVILNSWKMSCAGNPGSPVVCENQNHEIAVVGIASWTNFSLDCGDLPTYIDLGAFRIWMNNLVFNNKDTEEWKNNNKLSEKQCIFKGNTNEHSCLWNHSDLLQLDTEISYWPGKKVHLHNTSELIQHEEIPTETMNKTYFWIELHQSISKNHNSKNTSFFDGYYETSYTNTTNKPSNNIYTYKEIGKFQNNNQIVLFSARNKSLYNSQQFHEVVIKQNEDQIEIDDFELLLPFTLENINASYSNIVVAYPKRLYLFFHFVFWNLYILIYT
ncbi:Transmembrane protease serine 11D [Melipona quadrifasciata]|uniref:Transmembrane protease serine 11D n=1 Tax=Melipona quadrifasciata TaxID=166423 RepID=A0A0M9AAZ8_9HYME|nr:Transmembrane protease serine 11D [Melipona quadrifasciata]